MTILCGTDFTLAAAEAVDVAALLAARLGRPLRIVHVLDLPGAAEILADKGWPPSRVRLHVEGEKRELEERLRAEATRVASSAEATTAVLLGNADEAIVAEGERADAGLIVVGALGRRAGTIWNLGSTADRIAQASSRPVMVVRRGEGLLAWARGERALRVLVGVDATPVSDAAVRWIERLRAAGPVEVLGAHVYWPPEVRERLKIKGGIPLGEGHAQVDAVLARELTERLRAVPGGERVELHVVGGLGRTADHLVEVASEHRADLVVVGSHRREGFDRLWHGSVSRGVIDGASVSVVSVPSA